MNKARRGRLNCTVLYLCIITVILTGIGITGCGDKNRQQSLDADVIYEGSPKDEDLNKMVQNLMDNSFFEGEMAKVNERVVKDSYGLNETKENIEVYCSYMSTASKADEITIFRSNNQQETEEYIKQYIESRKKVFESYMPQEVKKLDNSLQVACGKERGIYILYIGTDKKAAMKQIKADLD